MAVPRTPLASGFAAVLWLLACEPGSGPEAPPGQTPSAAVPRAEPPAPATRSRSRDPDLASLDGDAATRIYYQFVDSRGKVQFVPTLEAVPPEWRDRVGFVEMSSPPPSRPGDARRLRKARMARMPSQRSAYSDDSLSDDAFAGRVEVILYSADWCGACTRAKRYMDDQGIDYLERDVDDPEWKQEMLAKAGPGGIPVFDIEGQILRGFSPRSLDKLIRQAS